MQLLAARCRMPCSLPNQNRFISAAGAPEAENQDKKPKLHFEMHPPDGSEAITLFLRPVPRKWRDKGFKSHGSLVVGVYDELLKSFGPIYAPTWLKKDGKKDYNCLFFTMEKEAGLRAISEINEKVPVPGQDTKFQLTEARPRKKQESPKSP